MHMVVETFLLFPVTPPHLLLQLSCGSHAAAAPSPKALVLGTVFVTGWLDSLSSPPLLSHGHSSVPKYHMFPHVEHINNFLPVTH